MKIDRKQFSGLLKVASKGLSTRTLVPGADMFVFAGGKITTFNGEVRVQVKDSIGLTAIVPSVELLNLVNRFSTDEIDVVMNKEKSEVRIKGASARAGITCDAVIDATSEIPAPGKWFKPSKNFAQHLLAASKVCGHDDTMGVTMCVRILPNRIEACDNYRAVRHDGATGVAEEFYLQASSIAALEGLAITKLSIQDGWMHARFDGGMISLRGRVFAEYPSLDDLFSIEGKEIFFPKELAGGITRSQVFTDKQTSAGQLKHITRVNVTISTNCAKISTGSSRGWFSEELKLKYDGPDLSFDAHPDSLLQILNHSFAVRFQKGKLIAKADKTCMVISTRSPNNG